MTKIFILVALAMTFSSLTFESIFNEQEAADRIVGVWKSSAEMDGQPQAVVTIKKTSDKINGSFVFRGLTVNGRDNVTLELPIGNASFDGTVLSFKLDFPDTEKTATEWELKLRSDSEGDFMLVKENGKPIEDAPSFVMKRVQ
jgi:hypothetical protein